MIPKTVNAVRYHHPDRFTSCRRLTATAKLGINMAKELMESCSLLRH